MMVAILAPVLVYMAILYDKGRQTMAQKAKKLSSRKHAVYAEHLCLAFMRKNKKGNNVIIYPKGAKLRRHVLSYHVFLTNIVPFHWNEVLFDHTRERVTAITRNIDEIKEKLLSQYIMPNAVVAIIVDYTSLSQKNRQRTW